jgi:hypothetical protein
MKTKLQIITELKSLHPSLKKGDDNSGYIELSDQEYESTITQWADNLLLKEAEQTEAQAKAAQRQALLTRLGITEDEARLLLG